MFDLNREMKKTVAEIGLMVTLTVALAACSTSRMSPDALDIEVTDASIEQSVEQTPSLVESDTTPEHLVTGETQAPAVKKTRTLKRKNHASHSKKSRSFRLTKKQSQKLHEAREIEKIPEIASSPSAKEQELALGAGTVGQGFDVPPTPPPAAELDLPIFENESTASLLSWNVIVGVLLILGAASTAAWRWRRKDSPRRLILNS